MNSKIPTEDLLMDLRIGAEAIGRPPNSEEYQDCGLYSKTTYYNRFGDWESAIVEAGLDPSQMKTGSQKIPKDVFLKDVKRVIDEYDTTSLSDYQQHGKHRWHITYRHFDSWSHLLVELGELPNE